MGELRVLVVATAFAAWPLGAQTTSTPRSTGAEISRPEETLGGGGTLTVSADLLRHPITEKARRMLQKALAAMKSGDHEAAIGQLRQTLAKCPDSAPYVHSLLGVEYFRTSRFKEAARSFEQAVALLPHDAVNRYNLGLSLACLGDFERGEQQVRRSIELDPKSTAMQSLLDALVKQKRSAN